MQPEHWFVYYKLPAADLAAWLPRSEVLLRAVARDGGVQGRLLQRADEAAGLTTLMEVYEGIADPVRFGAALEAAVLAAARIDPPLALPVRHTERFRPAAR